jgi:hypothetical protein
LSYYKPPLLKRQQGGIVEKRLKLCIDIKKNKTTSIDIKTNQNETHNQTQLKTNFNYSLALTRNSRLTDRLHCQECNREQREL